MTPPSELATMALRSRSWLDLTAGLIAYMQPCEAADEDWRVVWFGFAPFHDCATRIGADPAWAFNVAAHMVGGKTGELARTFGRRSDVTPRAFAYMVVDGPGGPSYHPGPVGPEPPDSN